MLTTPSLSPLSQAQFAVILLHVVQAVYNGCRYDVRPQWTLVVYMLSHIALFGNFYKHTYRKKPPRDSAREGLNGKPRELKGLKSEEENGQSESHRSHTAKKEQ